MFFGGHGVGGTSVFVLMLLLMFTFGSYISHKKIILDLTEITTDTNNRN